MSDELILNVSFDSQTVTDATENWTLSGTPNVTYEQISGGSGYSLVTGRLGTPPTLVAVDQEAIYNEYTIDFNLYIKPSYTDTGWFSLFSLDTGLNYSGDYKARVYNGLTISLAVAGGSPEVTIDSPTSRWIHITIISGYDSDTGAYTAYLYVDSVLRAYKQGTRLNGSPFAIGKKLVLFNRGGSSFYLPNTPGLAIDGLTVIAGIHAPNQTPAISLPNLSRVFQNFCTWLGSQLSAVAKSGSYNDLSDKPTISTVNNGTLTIQKNGTNVATFTANQSTNATANITVPTKTSDLTNDSGFITSDNTKIPLAGSNQISGSLIPSTDNSIDIGSSTKNIKMLYTKGITINGAQFLPSNYIPRSGGAVMTATSLGKTDNLSSITICGGTDNSSGSSITVHGKNSANGVIQITASNGTMSSEFRIAPNGDARLTNCVVFYPASDNATYLGYSTSRWSTIYAATGTINTSDSRLKNSINDIDDKLLDAWGNIEPKQYKFNDATEKKGEKARYHTGYLAQDIQAECEKQGVNASDYGLFCYDEWEEQEEKKDENGQVIEPYRAKGDLYALRYEEALVVECKYLRRCIARLTARIEELEKSKEQEASK